MPLDSNVALPARDSWKAPDPGLYTSAIYHQAGTLPPPFPGANKLVPIDNRVAIDWIVAALKQDFSAFDRWLLVVPGTSEVPDHHTAYKPKTPPDRPGIDVISPEYRARIDHAEMLLRTKRVASVMISGGSVDVHPHGDWWCEAEMGRRYLLAAHSAKWPAGELEKRVVVEPWALHTECNIRNGERLAALLGLSRCTFLTTARDGVCSDQGRLFERMPLAIWMRPHYRSVVGYRIGDFGIAGTDHDGVFDLNGTPHLEFATRCYDGSNFPGDALLADTRWAQTLENK